MNRKRYTNIMFNNYILINIEKSYAISTIYIIFIIIYKKHVFTFHFYYNCFF